MRTFVRCIPEVSVRLLESNTSIYPRPPQTVKNLSELSVQQFFRLFHRTGVLIKRGTPHSPQCPGYTSATEICDIAYKSWMQRIGSVHSFSSHLIFHRSDFFLFRATSHFLRPPFDRREPPAAACRRTAYFRLSRINRRRESARAADRSYGLFLSSSLAAGALN